MGAFSDLQWLAKLPFQGIAELSKRGAKKVSESVIDPLITKNAEIIKNRAIIKSLGVFQVLDNTVYKYLLGPGYSVAEYSTKKFSPEILKRVNDSRERVRDSFNRGRPDLPSVVRAENASHEVWNSKIENVKEQKLNTTSKTDKDIIFGLTAKINNIREENGLNRLRISPQKSDFCTTIRKRAKIIHNVENGSDPGLPPIFHQIHPPLPLILDKASEDDVNNREVLMKKRSELHNGEINFKFDIEDNSYLIDGDIQGLFERILETEKWKNTILDPDVENLTIGLNREGNKIGLSIITTNYEKLIPESDEEEEETEEIDYDDYEDAGKDWYWRMQIPNTTDGRAKDSEIWNIYHGIGKQKAGEKSPRPFKNWYSLYCYYLFREQINELNKRYQIRVKRIFMPSERPDEVKEGKTRLNIIVETPEKNEHVVLIPGTNVVALAKEEDRFGSGKKGKKNKAKKFSEQLTLDEYYERLNEDATQSYEVDFYKAKETREEAIERKKLEREVEDEEKVEAEAEAEEKVDNPDVN